MSGRKVVIRLAFAPLQARWLLPLLLALALPLAADQLTVSTVYPSPFVQYNSIMTTGAGGQNTLFQRFGGRLGIGTENPASLLAVVGKTVVGGNYVPPGAEPLNTAGLGSGLSMADRTSGGSRWALYPESNYMALWADGAIRFQIYEDGRMTLCQVIYYDGNNQTFCPASRPYVYQATDVNGYATGIYNNNPVGRFGYMTCCAITN